MSKRLITLLLVAVLGACGGGQGDAVAPSTSGAEATTSNGARPFLWRVEGGASPSYLFGTIHVAVALDEALPPPFADRALGAREAVFELDPAGVDPSLVARYAQLEGGRALDQLLAPEVFRQIADEVADVLPVAALRGVRPWLTSVMLMAKRIGALQPSGGAAMMDAELMTRARQAGVDVRFLETADQQLSAVAAVSDESMAEDLRRMVEERAEMETQLRGMLSAYRAGDEAAMMALLFDPEEMRRKPDLYQHLFFARNQAWLAELRPRFEAEGGLFVAVGLGHLLGPEGLVEGLRAAGFTVEREGPR